MLSKRPARPMLSKRPASRLRLRSAFVILATVLASAVPVAGARAATPALPASADLAAYAPWLLPVGFAGPAFAWGGVDIGDAFNGGTTVCVSTGASACSTNGSP